MIINKSNIKDCVKHILENEKEKKASIEKTFTALDADEAKEYIGKVGYFGNTLKDIEEKKYVLRLKEINKSSSGYRFNTKFLSGDKSYFNEDFAFFLPFKEGYVPFQNLEKAEEFVETWIVNRSITSEAFKITKAFKDDISPEIFFG